MAQSTGTAGLRYFEGRSWLGLRRHAVLCQLAFAFLQHLRLGGQTRSPPPQRRSTARSLAGNAIENVWDYLRGNKLSNRMFDTYEAIVDACSDA